MINSNLSPKQQGIFAGLPWVLVGNAVYMLSMALLTFILPRFLPPQDFGFWQLYQFYALYLGYLTFGYPDGVLLRLAGRSRDEYPREQLSSGFGFLVTAELLAFVAIAVAARFLLPDAEWFALSLALIGTAFYIPRCLITFVFQAAGQARMVAYTTVVERLALLTAFGLFIVIPGLDLRFLLAADVVGKLIGLIAALAAVRTSVTPRGLFSRANLRQFLNDCKDGTFVVLSNLSALALNGGIRFTVATVFGTLIFGQLSFALQISTVLLIVINAAATAIFPNLKRLGEAQYSRIYRTLDLYLTRPSFLALVGSWALVPILRWWIPDYEIAILLMVLLFPVGAYEVKSRGVLAVLMKGLRQERKMFVVNVIAATAGTAAAAIVAATVRDVYWTSLTMVAALWLRTVAMEVLVVRVLGQPILSRTLHELALVAAHYLIFYVGPTPLTITFLAGAWVTYAITWLRDVRSLRATKPAAADQ